MRYFFYMLLLIIWVALGIFWYQHRHNLWADNYQVDTTKISIITQFQSTQRLETQQMTVSKVIEGEKQLTDRIPSRNIDDTISSFLFEDKLVMQIEWVVVAWFDLKALTTWSITVHDNQSVTIALPPVEILHAYLTNETELFDRELWVLTKGREQFETELRNEAVNAITQESISAGILEQAKKSAQQSLQELLQLVDVELRNVVVEKKL